MGNGLAPVFFLILCQKINGFITVKALLSLKYIFINHSNLTRIIILGIIKEYNLNYKDCIVFNVRDQDKIEIKQIIQPTQIFPYIENYNFPRLFVLFLTVLFRLQLYFIVKGEFTLYAPNYRLTFVRVISIINKCKQLCQLEDGFVNYRYNVDECKKMYFAKSKGKFKNLFDSSGLIHKSCQKYFALHENAFQGEKNKVLITPGYRKKSNKFLCENEKHILVLAGSTKNSGIKENELLIKRFLKFCYDKKCEAHFKFHPDHTKREKKVIMDFINLMSPNKAIISEEILELALMSGVSITIHSLDSTLLIYQFLFTKTKGWCYMDINNIKFNENVNFFKNICNFMPEIKIE